MPDHSHTFLEIFSITIIIPNLWGLFPHYLTLKTVPATMKHIHFYGYEDYLMNSTYRNHCYEFDFSLLVTIIFEKLKTNQRLNFNIESIIGVLNDFTKILKFTTK